ncbi:signal transduction histidine kinase [Rhodobium orientis]|uniref:histidine kinase n=1 Tax=Rhodobium orientis TaxID=34017 RepID=A0A327JMN2_9HYPH|nr:HAMP domain-containing sensor histidine kinase [Rhodobium orientis]MBB4304688.1 signal transduction histidine kinase [Rhodobium orientis]MBK5950064.1 histidine kinase [Rhodobium orientis]RAI27750.1 histidine kinase [Rhodobium orientis]
MDAGADNGGQKGTANAAGPDGARAAGRHRTGLSGKLLFLTILFVMLSEVMIYVPSVANFRDGWLRDRLTMAGITAVFLHGERSFDRATQDKLLEASGALAIAGYDGERRRLIAATTMPPEVDSHIDMRDMDPWTSVAETFETLVFGGDRTLRVVGAPAMGEGFVEILIRDAPLREAMLTFSRNILALSLIISAITATLVYLSLRWLFVRPMQRLTRAMAEFSDDPENADTVIAPSGRADEIGDAELRLAAMQRELVKTLHQKRRLADLGLAVSKINHDLRNILASAQLFSDRLGTLEDPTVQRVTPKIVGALDRAIGYTRSVLEYGRAGEAAPERRLIRLSHLVDDVGDLLGVAGSETIEWKNAVDPELEIDADPDQLFRVLMNLCRNAVQVLDGKADPTLVRRLEVGARRGDGATLIQVRDTGPGVPEQLRPTLFQAFSATARKGGTGLGLAIAAELVRAHGGTISLTDAGPGACFEIHIPDRGRNGQRNAMKDRGRPEYGQNGKAG